MNMLSVRPLPKELQEVAIRTLNENPATIKNDLDEMRDWIKKQTHLKVRTDDQWLLTLLRGCRFKLDRAKQKIEALCAAKTNLPQYFENRDPFLPELQELINIGGCLPLKKSDDPAAPRVVLIRRSTADPAQVLPSDAIKYVSMIIDILLNEDDNFVIAGGRAVCDGTGASPKYAYLFNPSEAMTVFYCYRDAYALRAKGAYFINTPGFFETIYNACKSWLPLYIQKMIHMYKESNPQELYDVVPLSILPKEYGGNGGSVDDLTAQWKAKIESYRNWFLEDERYCLLEAELPEDSQSSWLGVGWLMNKLSFE